MIDVDKTIISQYANSPRLLGLIEDANDAIDPAPNLKDFYDLVWNIDTATSYGLDVWGRIVDIGRYFQVDKPEAPLGFETGVSDFAPFNQGVFAPDAGLTTSYRLEDEAYRLLILCKALTNIVTATSYNINRVLQMLFDGRRAYYMSLGNMHARYVFEFDLAAIERAIVFQTEVLPRPSGVQLDFYQITPDGVFSFNHSGLQPFNQGVFK